MRENKNYMLTVVLRHEQDEDLVEHFTNLRSKRANVSAEVRNAMRLAIRHSNQESGGRRS